MIATLLSSFSSDPCRTLCSLVLSAIVLLLLAIVADARRRRYNRENLQLCFQRASRFRVGDEPVLGGGKTFDTIVIGSGPGGCTCANLLAAQGQRVLVLEQHPTSTGGGTHSFRMEGCEWDTGLHYSSAAISMRTTRPGTIMGKSVSAVRRVVVPYASSH
jgi:NAD(P)-binding Rossmann-like domain